MKRIVSIIGSILFTVTVFGQQNNSTANGFTDFNEFKQNSPSLTFGFQVRQRTNGNIFMKGGIANYRLEDIEPKSDKEKLEKEVWGVLIHDSTYINSYPYSKVKGYNLILEKGYYTYFIGEPARTKQEQEDLGIIKSGGKLIAVCCQVGYIILPEGTVKLLRPKLLLELCKDNEVLSKEIMTAKLKFEDVNEMFDFLKKYNATKK